MTEYVTVVSSDAADSGSPAFYERRGDLLWPGALAAGPPWLPGTQHGSMVTALMARAADQTPSPVPMQLVRLTVDLSRPVPTGLTRVDVRISRDGKRLQALDLELIVDDTAVSRGTAVRIRTDDVLDGDDMLDGGDMLHGDDMASIDRSGDPPSGSPEQAELTSPLGPDPLWDAHGARWESHRAGSGTVWLRPIEPLVADEPLTPTLRVAMVADLVMTDGTMLPRDRYVAV
ncbi:MAG: acyl-CoA thioesterase domain-containing protein, partial [Acidimicrobiia bacterium]